MPDICIGTANFFNKYGISDTKLENFFEVLSYAKKHSIKKIDYSVLYGRPTLSQKKILKRLDFKISLKLPIYHNGKFFNNLAFDNIEFWEGKIESISVHDPWNLDFETYNEIAKTAKKIKNKYSISFGFSIYKEEDLKFFFKTKEFDFLQLPHNPLNSILLDHLKKKDKRNLKVQIRSIFLQGLLLSSKIPNSITNSKLIKAHSNWVHFLNNNSYDGLSYCIEYAKDQK